MISLQFRRLVAVLTNTGAPIVIKPRPLPRSTRHHPTIRRRLWVGTAMKMVKSSWSEAAIGSIWATSTWAAMTKKILLGIIEMLLIAIMVWSESKCNPRGRYAWEKTIKMMFQNKFYSQRYRHKSRRVKCETMVSWAWLPRHSSRDLQLSRLLSRRICSQKVSSLVVNQKLLRMKVTSFRSTVNFSTWMTSKAPRSVRLTSAVWKGSFAVWDSSYHRGLTVMTSQIRIKLSTVKCMINSARKRLTYLRSLIALRRLSITFGWTVRNTSSRSMWLRVASCFSRILSNSGTSHPVFSRKTSKNLKETKNLTKKISLTISKPWKTCSKLSINFGSTTS